MFPCCNVIRSCPHSAPCEQLIFCMILIPITSCDNLCDRTVSKQRYNACHIQRFISFLLGNTCYVIEVMFPSNFIETHTSRFGVDNSELHTSQHWNIVINCHFLYDMLKQIPQMTYSIYWPTKGRDGVKMIELWENESSINREEHTMDEWNLTATGTPPRSISSAK